MTLDDFLQHVKARRPLDTPEIYRLMDEMNDEARRITCQMNYTYHTQEELRVLFSQLTGTIKTANKKSSLLFIRLIFIS